MTAGGADEFEVVVIGGGPAGGLLARLLARRGLRTALVERGPRGRPKTCGECLSPRACRVLADAGLLEDTERLAAGRARGVRVHVPGRPPLRVPLPRLDAVGRGLIVQRSRFDQLLIDRAAGAGAHVLQPACARLVTAGARGAVVEVAGRGRLRGRLVVGADGLRSGVARVAGLAGRRRRRGAFGFALDARWPEALKRGAVRAGTIEMFVVPEGYLGAVVHDDGSVHLAALVTRRAAGGPPGFLRSVADRFAALRGAGMAGLAARRRGRLLGAGPIPCAPRRVAGPSVALVGDAAGYREPFTGEGMSWALQSAALLAASVGPGGWEPAASADYRRRWRREIARRQRLCRVLGSVLLRPGLTRAVHRAAGRRPVVARALLRRALLP